MRPTFRKLVLTAHVTFSVGWLGAVAAYLAPAIVGLSSQDLEVVRGCYLVMGLMGWFIIVPLALGALLTGLVQSLGTEWGLFRHYWILTKFGLTVLGATVLLVHMRTVSGVSGMTPEMLSTASHGHVKMQLVVHAAGGLVILLVATTLSIFKPWGKTAYGRRKAS
jgi:hypothetical protein